MQKEKKRERERRFKNTLKSTRQPGTAPLGFPRMHYKGIISSIVETHYDLELQHRWQPFPLSAETISPTPQLFSLSFYINEYTKKDKNNT